MRGEGGVDTLSMPVVQGTPPALWGTAEKSLLYHCRDLGLNLDCYHLTSRDRNKMPNVSTMARVS